MTVAFIKETYADDYDTLRQAIIIDTLRDIHSNGQHSKYLRQKVNPNLHLIFVEHINEEGDVIYAKRVTRVR